VQRFIHSFVLLSFLFSTTFGNVARAGDIDWNPENRPPIRSLIQKCHTLLAPKEAKANDSVGVIISGNTPEEFAQGLDKVLAEKGPTAILGGKFFVTGIAMGKEKETRTAFEAALKERDLLRDGTTVTVLSFPKRNVKQLMLETAGAILDRIRYFFPSFARDYQAPLAAEVTSGIGSGVAVEIPNIVFLYSALPTLDANLVVGVHAAVLVAYSVYAKFMLNWLLRPGSNGVEQFLKNASISLPFIVNYSVFGRFSEIVKYYSEHGWAATASQFPAELANFSTTQGLTLFLQVMFYNIVITNGVGGWQNQQSGTEDSEQVRTLSNYIKVPILALDAIALAMAGGNGTPLWSMGPFDVNTGHLVLAGLTLLGSIFYFKPEVLNPTLRWYRAFLGWVNYLRGKPNTPAPPAN
jgi:hypothetical protein